jgi:hypothetical protein
MVRVVLPKRIPEMGIPNSEEYVGVYPSGMYVQPSLSVVEPR